MIEGTVIPQRTAPVPWLTLTARSLADARSRCWTTAQLLILDVVIDMLAEQYDQALPVFDDERFHALARFKHGHISTT